MYGPRKTERNCRLAGTTKPNWSVTIPRIHQVLSILCTKLLKNSVTTARSYEERTSLAMEMTPTWCLWRTKNQDVLQPSINSTWLQREILPLNRCIGLRCGRHTLTKGKGSTLTQTLKTKNSSNCVLLSNVHSHGMKLWHLWMRTISNNKIISTLATIPRMDERTIHYPYRPCQPPILEGTSKP
jgi:hypothetical protein